MFFFYFLFAFITTAVFAEENSATTYQVSVPVTDLRTEPVSSSLNDFSRDPFQETQLLYGEKVMVLEQKEGWSRVEAIEQLEWTHHEKWEGYPGWIQSDHLAPLPAEGWEPNAVITSPQAAVHQTPDSGSPVLVSLFIGTKIVSFKKKFPPHPTLSPIGKEGKHALSGLVLSEVEGVEGGKGEQWQPVLLIDDRSGWIRQDQIDSLESLNQFSETDLRKRILAAGRSFIGKPYYWGGLAEGVDCSGLVHLSYRANGISLPRDAHEQYLKSERIDQNQLTPGDLIFLSSEEDTQRMTHVMIYSGDGKIIEGPGTGKFVHQTSMDEKLSQNSHRKVYYGRILDVIARRPKADEAISKNKIVSPLRGSQ